MIRSYFKIAWRNLLRNRVYSGIHIAGLAIGMTAALGIGLWIWDELSFDRFHENHGQIAQVYVTQTFGSIVYTGSTVSLPLGESLYSDYADNFDNVAMTSFTDADVFSKGEKLISSTGIWVQPDFPVMMTLKMKSGVRTALKDPSTLLLSASLARSLFGAEDPQNKTVRLDNNINMIVGGVFEDLPRNSSFYDNKYFLPWGNPVFQSTLAMGRQDWDNHMVQVFVQLNEKSNLEKVNARIRNLSSAHVNKGYKEEVLLHPMDKWHLYSNFVNGKIDNWIHCMVVKIRGLGVTPKQIVMQKTDEYIEKKLIWKAGQNNLPTKSSFYFRDFSPEIKKHLFAQIDIVTSGIPVLLFTRPTKEWTLPLNLSSNLMTSPFEIGPTVKEQIKDKFCLGSR